MLAFALPFSLLAIMLLASCTSLGAFLVGWLPADDLVIRVAVGVAMGPLDVQGQRSLGAGVLGLVRCRSRCRWGHARPAGVTASAV